MLFVTACAVFLGLVGHRLYWARRQHAAIKAVEASGGYVGYESGREYRTWPVRLSANLATQEKPEPILLERMFGRDFVDNVVEVVFPNKSNASPAIPPLVDFPHLHTLALPETPLSAVNVSTLQKLPRLKTVVFYAAGPPTAAIEMATRLNRIQEFNLCNSKSINDEHMRLVARMKALRTLNVWDTGVTDESLKHLATLPSLETLFINQTEITNAGLSILATFPKLKSLDIGGTAITDDGLKHLTALKSLEDLHLFRTPITDAGAEHLKQIKSLRKLWLAKTNVTEKGLLELRQDLPNCSVSRE